MSPRAFVSVGDPKWVLRIGRISGVVRTSYANPELRSGAFVNSPGICAIVLRRCNPLDKARGIEQIDPDVVAGEPLPPYCVCAALLYTITLFLITFYLFYLFIY